MFANVVNNDFMRLCSRSGFLVGYSPGVPLVTELSLGIPRCPCSDRTQSGYEHLFWVGNGISELAADLVRLPCCLYINL